MAYLIQLPSFTDERGNLTVLDEPGSNLPFAIKRVFYIHGAKRLPRGGHRHYETEEAVVCINGHCRITCDNDYTREEFLLNDPGQCLIIKAEDWRTLHNFSPDAVILVFASTVYDKADYIFEPYGGNVYATETEQHQNGYGH